MSFININEFKNYDKTQQAEALWESGIIVAYMKDEIFMYILYQIESFYVEVKYHISKNTIKGLKCFSDTEQLKPYLNLIDISNLFPNKAGV